MKHHERLRLFELGSRLEGYELSSSATMSIGEELVQLSGVCKNCHGSGEDGDPPDAAGEGGGRFPCEKCKGKGLVVDDSAERKAQTYDHMQSLAALHGFDSLTGAIAAALKIQAAAELLQLWLDFSDRSPTTVEAYAVQRDKLRQLTTRLLALPGMPKSESTELSQDSNA